MRSDDTDKATPARAMFEVEMTKTVAVTIDLPDGHTLDDCSSKRLHRWPDSVLEAIEQAVAEKLLEMHGHELVRYISEISYSDASATH